MTKLFNLCIDIETFVILSYCITKTDLNMRQDKFRSYILIERKRKMIITYTLLEKKETLENVKNPTLLIFTVSRNYTANTAVFQKLKKMLISVTYVLVCSVQTWE